MAASRKTSLIANRLLTQISRHHSFFRRAAVHANVYDKNEEDVVQPNTVQDEVIKLEADKYWAPHPKTGVFGPAADNNKGVVNSSPTNREEPLMEEKAWFRPTSLEDLEKPV